VNLRQAISTFRGNRVPNVDFMGKKKYWFALSGVFILLSIVGLAARQLNFSIAFTGGSLLEFPNRSGVSVQEYQQIMARFGLPDAQVEVIGANQISIRTESLAEAAAPEPSASPSPEASASASGSPEASPSATSSAAATSTPTPSTTSTSEAAASPTATGSVSPSASASAGPGITGTQRVRADELRAALARKAGIPVDQINETDVGPTWGATISRKMITGLIVFLVLVSLYITLRFEWKMALGALGALLHDLIITTGVFALVGREVTPETVIAILTILGYSLYDTVVIYDKVKENTESTALIAQNTYSGVVNISLNQTLMRSVNTSLVVLFPIGALLVFGGQTLKDFAFALFIGVASGTYSSIFVAAPVLAVLKEREPRFQQIQVRARSRAARPGLRAVPAAAVPGRIRTTDTSTPAAEPAAASTRTMVGPTGAGRRTGGTGTGPKRKKPRPQGKPKRRRR
jgi:preprotein translocase subunit SecF